MYLFVLDLCKVYYMILHADLHVYVHECKLTVYLLSAAELGSSLALLSETSGRLDSLELLMRMRECKLVTVELGSLLELLLETRLTAIG